ncbi:MAG: hypothetical protein RL669_499 [Pseudomonadota bacterium]|jgi:uncharacterized protein YqgC (DUF456 family)
MDALWWTIAVILMLVGLAGTVLPALPGVPLIFAGIVLAAWIGHFEAISVTTLVILGVLTAIGVVADFVATALGAKRAGASRYGIIGAALGTVVGVFTGLWGLVFMPLVGAALGEFYAHRDALKAGRVGLATWVGMLLGTAVKLAIALTLIGVFLAALLF